MTIPQRGDKWRRLPYAGGRRIALGHTSPPIRSMLHVNRYSDADIEAAIEPDEPPAKDVFDRVWTWSTRLPERKGMRCRVVVAGRMQSALIEFQDGYRVVASVRGLRRVKGE